MSTSTLNSAYPRSVQELLPAARQLAARIGKLPSRNLLMQELKVGSPKATALREALARGDDARTTLPAGAGVPGRQARPADPADTTADTGTAPDPDPGPASGPAAAAGGPADRAVDVSVLPDPPGHPDPNITTDAGPTRTRRMVAWPVLLLAAPAFVAIWAGWVELGTMTGFGKVNLLPGIGPGFDLDIAITLPVGMETYAAYALWVWLSGRAPATARRFAKWSAIAALAIGAAGQVTYHLMSAAGWSAAPWPVTALVACLPVAVLGMGAALAHLLRTTDTH